MQVRQTSSVIQIGFIHILDTQLKKNAQKNGIVYDWQSKHVITRRIIFNAVEQVHNLVKTWLQMYDLFYLRQKQLHHSWMNSRHHGQHHLKSPDNDGHYINLKSHNSETPIHSQIMDKKLLAMIPAQQHHTIVLTCSDMGTKATKNNGISMVNIGHEDIR